MGKRKYLSKFNPDWLEMDQFKSWLKIVKEDDTAAYCNTCMSKFDVGNIGLAAIESHGRGTKHKRRMLAQEAQINVLRARQPLAWFLRRHDFE